MFAEIMDRSLVAIRKAGKLDAATGLVLVPSLSLVCQPIRTNAKKTINQSKHDLETVEEIATLWIYTEIPSILFVPPMPSAGKNAHRQAMVGHWLTEAPSH